MFDKLKKTTKHTAIYSLGNLSNKIAGIVLLPLYTAFLTTADYGIFSIFEITLQILIAVLGLNLHTAMLRFCSSQKSENKIKSIIFTTYFVSLFTTLAFYIPLVIYSNRLADIIFQKQEYSILFSIVFSSMSIGIFNRITLNVIRLRSKAMFYAISTSLKFLVILISNIYFIVYVGWGVKALLLSRLLSEIFLFIITLPFLKKNIKLKIDIPILKEMLRYGIPLIFSTISAMILNFSNRYIMKPMLGDEQVGIYSMGYKVAGLINVLIIQSFQTSFLPIAYKMVNTFNAKRFFSKVLTYFVLILSFTALGISLYGREIFEIMAKNTEWITVYKIIPLLSLFFILSGIRYVFSLGTHYVKKTKYNAYVVMSAAIINIGLNLFLIQKFDIYGAAIASILSMIYMAVLFFKISQKLYYIPFELVKLVKVIGLAIVLFCLSYLFFNLNILWRIILKIGLILVYPILLYFMGFFDNVELLRIRQIWQKWKNPKNWKKNLNKIKLK
ncbi:MAG: lipopolysaccharide biosynthesis protein [Candidatus Helarchaeota archaeon]